MPASLIFLYFAGVSLSAFLRISEKYKKMSDAGLNHVKTSYNFENYEKSWIETMDRIIETHGSWENRKNYKRWHLMEVA